MTDTPHSLVLRGRQALARGDLAATSVAAEERLRTDPRDISALELRYLVHKARGDMAQAVSTLQAAIAADTATNTSSAGRSITGASGSASSGAANGSGAAAHTTPDNNITSSGGETLTSSGIRKASADWAYNELVQLLLAHNRLADAEQVARKAVRSNPRNAQAHNLFGTVLSQLNDLPSGEWHFRRALELLRAQQAQPPVARPPADELPLLTNLAVNLMQQGRTGEAESFFAQAHALAPTDMKILAHWSKLHEVQGNLAQAAALLDQAEAISSKEAVSLLRASYLVRAKQPHEALALLNAAPTLSGQAQLERGQLHDRLGHYEQAWQDFVTAKQKLSREGGGLDYKADTVEVFFSRLRHFFTQDNFELLPRAAARTDTPQPIFIMGFPRSGTTMIEQALCSHSLISPGGELAFIGELRRLSSLLLPGPEPFPENLAQSWTADNRFIAAVFRDYYLTRAGQCGLFQPGARFFTDKMPFNEMYLPLVRMAFPEAKIIRIVRHPLDVCVSMLSNNLTHGFNCGYDIANIVRHFTAIAELVAHYRRELDWDDFVLKYESFVRTPRAELQRVFAHLGVPFEEASLRFHENRRYAPTPSYAQVTEKLHDRSIGRYKHYAAHLQPYPQQLRPLLSEHGYEA